MFRGQSLCGAVNAHECVLLINLVVCRPHRTTCVRYCTFFKIPLFGRSFNTADSASNGRIVACVKNVHVCFHRNPSFAELYVLLAL